MCNHNTSSFTDLLEIDNSVSVHHRNIQVLATEIYTFVNSLSPKLVGNCFKLNNMTVIILKIGPLSILSKFAQSIMAQNHSPNWERKFGNWCQVIWKTFHYLQPSKKPLKNGSHTLFHVGFVEPTSTRLVSFNLWIQNQRFLHGFLVLCTYMCMYVYVCKYVCACVCDCIYICMYIYIYYIYIYVCIYVCMYMCVYMYVCIYIYMYICMYVCVYIHKYICVIFDFMLLEHYLLQFY